MAAARDGLLIVSCDLFSGVLLGPGSDDIVGEVGLVGVTELVGLEGVDDFLVSGRGAPASVPGAGFFTLGQAVWTGSSSAGLLTVGDCLMPESPVSMDIARAFSNSSYSCLATFSCSSLYLFSSSASC